MCNVKINPVILYSDEIGDETIEKNLPELYRRIKIITSFKQPSVQYRIEDD